MKRTIITEETNIEHCCARLIIKYKTLVYFLPQILKEYCVINSNGSPGKYFSSGEILRKKMLYYLGKVS